MDAYRKIREKVQDGYRTRESELNGAIASLKAERAVIKPVLFSALFVALLLFFNYRRGVNDALSTLGGGVLLMLDYALILLSGAAAAVTVFYLIAIKPGNIKEAQGNLATAQRNFDSAKNVCALVEKIINSPALTPLAAEIARGIYRRVWDTTDPDDGPKREYMSAPISARCDAITVDYYHNLTGYKPTYSLAKFDISDLPGDDECKALEIVLAGRVLEALDTMVRQEEGADKYDYFPYLGGGIGSGATSLTIERKPKPVPVVKKHEIRGTTLF